MHVYDFHSRRYYRVVATLNLSGARCPVAQAFVVYLAEAATHDKPLLAIPGHGFREALNTGAITLAESKGRRGHAPLQSFAAMRCASTAALDRERGEPRMTSYPETFFGLESFRGSAEKHGLNSSLHAAAKRLHVASRRARG